MERIEKLRKRTQVDSYPLCMEKIKLMTEAFRESEGEPQIVRRAKAQAKILDNITIFIEDDELIVGNVASKPMGVEVEYWMGTWPEEGLNELINEGWGFSDQDKADLADLNDFWKSKSTLYRQAQLLDDRLWPFGESGLCLPPYRRGEEWGGWAQGGMGIGPIQGLLAVNYPEVLNRGLIRIIEEAENELENLRIKDLDSVKKIDFLKSVIIIDKAIIRFAQRFSVLAKTMADKESDPVRRRELERIADICLKVPANPATNFYEAIQSFWFIFLVLNPNQTLGIGRFDQYMYPFYEEDKQNGTITDREVIELLACLRIKDSQINSTSPSRDERDKWSGMAKWHNMIIGGQTPDGRDAANELSYLILEAAEICPTPHHTITLRVHEGTPEPLMLKAIEVVRLGIGMPAFVSDQSNIDFFVNRGVSLEVARDYVIGGCLDVALMGKSRSITVRMFVVPLVLDIFMHNGVEPRTGRQLGIKTGDLESFTTFEDLMAAFKKQLTYIMGLFAEWNNLTMQVGKEILADSLYSSLMDDGIKIGKDMGERIMPFENGACMCAIGMINVADSLAAIKKLVFEDKKATMEELKAALEANWQGHEELHKTFMNAPKYGNDLDYVDSIAAELYQFWADSADSFDSPYKGKYLPLAISISAQWPGGALTGATPDGRYAGECLADGTMSAMRGRDTRGPIALVKSAAKINQIPYQSTLLNMKFHPSALQSTEDMEKLSILIKTYFSMGGKHVQFNVASRETLLDAQQHPENHRDLIVRVAGYSAYFVQLSKAVQDEVIGRMEYQAA